MSAQPKASELPRCEGWQQFGTTDGVPRFQCTAAARQLFVWWPGDPKEIGSVLCARHARKAQDEATEARVPYRRVSPMPDEYRSLAMLRGSYLARQPEPER